MAYNTAATQTITPQVTPNATVQGKVVYDATSITTTDYTRVAVGFKPRYVRWENLTDRIAIEWFEGMTSSQLLKTAAAGTKTLDTTASAFVVDDRGFAVLQDATLGAIAASKTCYFIAMA